MIIVLVVKARIIFLEQQSGLYNRIINLIRNLSN